jgi:peptidoglycan/LPS O-acetylase OafA/YrhL
MISHEIWMALPGSTERFAPPLLGLAVLVLFFTLSIPLALWIAVLASVLAARGPLKSVLNSVPLQFLGRVSYSTYLGHMLVLWSVQALLLQVWPGADGWRLCLALCVLGIPLILVLSALLHRWVEAPSIRFGRQLFAR